MNSNKLPILLTLILSLALSTSKAVVREQVKPRPQEPVHELTQVELIDLNSKQSSKLKRKPTLKEKLALRFVGKKRSVLTEEAKTDAFAIAGFVASIVGIFFAGLILGVVGVVFSVIALKRIKKDPTAREGRKLAIAGLVLGIIAFVAWVALLLIVLLLLA